MCIHKDQFRTLHVDRGRHFLQVVICIGYRISTVKKSVHFRETKLDDDDDSRLIFQRKKKVDSSPDSKPRRLMMASA